MAPRLAKTYRAETPIEGVKRIREGLRCPGSLHPFPGSPGGPEAETMPQARAGREGVFISVEKSKST